MYFFILSSWVKQTYLLKHLLTFVSVFSLLLMPWGLCQRPGAGAIYTLTCYLPSYFRCLHVRNIKLLLYIRWDRSSCWENISSLDEQILNKFDLILSHRWGIFHHTPGYLCHLQTSFKFNKHKVLHILFMWKTKDWPLRNTIDNVQTWWLPASQSVSCFLNKFWFCPGLQRVFVDEII